MSQAWPTADLGPLQRLRVLASAVHAPMCVEDYIDEPFDKVWAVAGDLQAVLPRLVRTMRSFEYRTVNGENISARATGKLGNHADFEVILRPGWCIMQSRFVVGGMAAVPDGNGTRFAVLGGTRAPGSRALRALLRPLGKVLGRGMIRRLRKQLAAG
jgi:hypothetical protein